jgi:hypothetical protein
MHEIPTEIDAAVRTEAAEARGYTGGLDNVYRRARQRRRRQVAGAFTAVIAVLALAGTGVLLRPGRQHALVVPPAGTTSPPSVAAAPPPAQRLLLSSAIGVYRVGVGPSITLGGASQVGELLPGDQIAARKVIGADSWDRSIGLPDGRIVALGPHDLLPGKKRSDGPHVEGLEVNLVVTGADGRVQVQRNVRKTGEGVALLAADRTAAFLWRPAGLVMHDLGSGSERVVVTRTELGVSSPLDGSLSASDLVDRWLVISPASSPCSLTLFTDGGATPQLLPVRGVGCEYVNGLRLSPDADRVAVSYQTTSLTTGIAILGISDGTVLGNWQFAEVSGAKKAAAVDMAWQDNMTLRSVAYPVGAGGTQPITPLTMTTK